MGEVVPLFPRLPGDLDEGDLVWLSRFATFGTVTAIEPTGRAEIATNDGAVRLHLIRDRDEIHTWTDAAFLKAAT